MRIPNGSIVALSAAAILLGGCSEKPTAPSGTDLSGVWATQELEMSAGGTAAYFVIIFTVANQTVSDIGFARPSYGAGGQLAIDSQYRGSLVPGSAAIVNGRFEFSRTFSDIVVNGNPAKVTIKGTFRSATEADGNWRNENYGIEGYSVTGSYSGGWRATRIQGR